MKTSEHVSSRRRFRARLAFGLAIVANDSLSGFIDGSFHIALIC